MKWQSRGVRFVRVLLSVVYAIPGITGRISSEMRTRVCQMSAEAVGNTPQEFDVFVKAEIIKWGEVIKALHLRID